jgi:hypothetical protein
MLGPVPVRFGILFCAFFFINPARANTPQSRFCVPSQRVATEPGVLASHRFAIPEQGHPEQA